MGTRLARVEAQHGGLVERQEVLDSSVAASVESFSTGADEACSRSARAPPVAVADGIITGGGGWTAASGGATALAGDAR